MAKKAVITVKLVDESVFSSNSSIASEMLEWFLTALPAPWVKQVDNIFVLDSYRRSKFKQ